MKPSPGLRAALPALLLIVLPQVGTAAVETVTIDGIPHIRNSAEPSLGTRRIELEELWRAGGDDEEVFFGVIADALADSLGNLYLLDRQLCQIFVYSPSGEFVRVLGREGEGPGEFRSPTDLVWMPAGHLGIIHRAPGVVTLVDTLGTPQGSLRLHTPDGAASSARLRAMLYRGGTLAASGQERTVVNERLERRRFLALYAPDGTEHLRLMEAGTGFDFENHRYLERDDYFIDRGGWTLGTDGLVYLAPERDHYRIDVFRPDGQCLRVIERDYEPHRRTAEEKAAAANVSMSIHGRRVDVEAIIEETDPCIARLFCHPSGHLGVIHSHSNQDLPEGVFIRYDIFDPAGEYLECVEVASPGDVQRDRLIPLADGRYVLLRGIHDAIDAMFGAGDPAAAADEAPAPLEVICLAPAS
ncbi:MAG: hypothetical protein KAY32_00075 [Candidatus Eisenbacteria sp.]|nr:hypothetical protein [Candidatus Eisenbacteria bacterium]